MMKGGKEEEKLMGPMFPRLHVNDTEKGGPRAPPRNKMALYEQLSIPSQRFNSSAGKISQPHNSKNMVLSASSSQGVGCERSMFSPLHIPPTSPPQSTEKLHPSASDGINLNTNVPEFERKSTMNLNNKQPNFMGHFLPNQGCSLFRPLDNSALKTCQKEIGEEDDFRVPTFVHSRISQHGPLDKDRQTRFSTNYPGWTTTTASSSPQKNVGPTCNSLIQQQNVCEKPQHQNVCEKPLKRLNTMGIKLRYHRKDQIEQKTRETVVNKHSNSSSVHSRGEKIEEPSKYAEGSVDKEHPHGMANSYDNSCSPKTRLQHEGLNAEKSNIPMVKGESGSRASFGSRHISRNVAENCSVRSEDKVQESLQVGDEERNDDSETSMVDSISGLEISPDDVVGVIGQKHFWKARRAIVNQQRVFAVQVFELHRLIKVQKLIAGSPELLLERYPYLASSQKVSCGKVLPSESLLKPQLLAIKEREDSGKPSQTTECPSSNPVGKPSHPSISSGFDKGLINQKSSCGPYSANAPTPLGPDSKAGQWCFPPPGNQWLVPVVSPSEGLIYKPYRGPCPPTGGFVAPVYGGYGPINLPPAAENFIGPPYGLQAPHHQQGGVIMSNAPNYFPPYGLPVMNPTVPTSTFEQMNRAGDPLMSTAQVEHFSEVNFNPHSRNSCNISNRGSIGPSNCIRKLPSSKGSEAHGSTASSPSYQQQGADHISGGRDPLPLFPMAPAAEGSDRTSPARSSGKKSRVIKVVPHNPRSATANESAARIFQSIQEERQHHDSH